jgi:hypothetical protein
MENGKTLKTAITLVIGLTFLAGASLGQTDVIPVSGEDMVAVTDYGDMWTDSDGVTHIRRMIVATDLSGQDVHGVPVTGTGTYEANFNIDFATGDGDMRAWGPLVMDYGDYSGSWRVMFTATLTGWVYDGEFNAARGYGDFAGWHFRGTWVGFYGSDTPNLFDGYFQIPGGDKAAATEAHTLSSVKDLFR